MLLPKVTTGGCGCRLLTKFLELSGDDGEDNLVFSLFCIISMYELLYSILVLVSVFV